MDATSAMEMVELDKKNFLKHKLAVTKQIATFLLNEIEEGTDIAMAEHHLHQCRLLIESWLHIAKEQSGSEFSHYCRLRRSTSNESRSLWQRDNKSGWSEASVWDLSLRFGSQYIAACTIDENGRGITEFHICDSRDCTNLASALKCNLARCVEEINRDKERGGGLNQQMTKGDSNGCGLVRLIKEKDPASDTSDLEDTPKACEISDGDRCEIDSPLPAIEVEFDSNEIGPMSDDSTPSTSRNGFVSHYAYGRTCDMLESMIPSNKLLSSVIDDETEQLRCAGRVRQLIEMFDKRHD